MGNGMNDINDSASQKPLIFCCSGTADVGEIGHQAARALDDHGYGSRFCLAGIGGRVPAHIQKTQAAASILVIDGCRVSCGRKTLAAAGFTNLVQVQVDGLGLPKGSSPVTVPHVQRVVAAAMVLINQVNTP